MSNIKFIGSGAKIKWLSFSDHTETCKIERRLQGSHGSVFLEPSNHIMCDVEDGARDIIRIGLVKDALERMGIKDIKLTLGYMPQARADRVFEEGNPLPIKVFTDILNGYNFSKVYIFDPHSDVTSALVNNVEILTQSEMLMNEIPKIRKLMGKDFTLVAPDLGATKKIFDSVQALRHDNYYQAIKVRDVTTGTIIKCDLIEKEVSGNVLIVDDLADGAASFKFLAKKLKQKGADKVGLYVTHGIFSKGLEVLEKEVDFIFCPNVVCKYINREDITKFNNK